MKTFLFHSFLFLAATSPAALGFVVSPSSSSSSSSFQQSRTLSVSTTGAPKGRVTSLAASKLPRSFYPSKDKKGKNKKRRELAYDDDEDEEDENPLVQVAPKIFAVFIGSFVLTQIIETPGFQRYVDKFKNRPAPKYAVAPPSSLKATPSAPVAPVAPVAPAPAPAYVAPAPRYMNPEEREAMEVAKVKQDVEDTTRLWLNTVTGNRASTPRETVNLYARDAILWGTVSEQTRVTTDEIQDYFDFFAALPNLKVTSYKGNVRILDPPDKTIAANDGYYTFSFTDPNNGATVNKKARFSFIYRKDPMTGKWLIVDHHSSALPSAPSSLEQAYTVRDIPKTLESDVEDTTKLWLKTVTSGRPNAWEQTSALYAKDAVLWGTVSEQVRVTPQEIEDYFKFFAQLPDLRVTSYKGTIRILDDPKNTLAANDGYYTFEFTKMENGERTNVVKRARYSFIYRKDPNTGRWMIIDHHSSALPNAPTALKQSFRFRDINT